MLLMIIIGMIGEYAMLFIHQYVKTNNKYRKESLQLNYWYVNNLYRRAMSQKLPVDRFRWVENTSKFNKNFIENYREDVDEVYFLEVDV